MASTIVSNADIAAVYGRRIRRRRRALNMTCTDLAEAAGVSQPTVSRYESGQRRPDTETKQLLAAALNVPVKDLFAW